MQIREPASARKGEERRGDCKFWGNPALEKQASQPIRLFVRSEGKRRSRKRGRPFLPPSPLIGGRQISPQGTRKKSKKSGKWQNWPFAGAKEKILFSNHAFPPHPIYTVTHSPASLIVFAWGRERGRKKGASAKRRIGQSASVSQIRNWTTRCAKMAPPFFGRGDTRGQDGKRCEERGPLARP